MVLKQETHITHTNPETGEQITSVTSKTYNKKVTNTEEFYMVFLSGVEAMNNSNSSNDIKILSKLCSIAEYNTGIVLVPSGVRKKIALELNITIGSLNNSLHSLKKNKYINFDDGIVEINPLYFWKGDFNTRSDLLKTKKFIIDIEMDSYEK